jgi:hypothetical protein
VVVSRLFIFGSFNVIWVMTPEYYPTSVRSFALGINNAFSRSVPMQMYD